MQQNLLCTEAVIRKFSAKKTFLENLQNSQEKTSAGVSFLIMLQASTLSFILKSTPPQELFSLIHRILKRKCCLNMVFTVNLSFLCQNYKIVF